MPAHNFKDLSGQRFGEYEVLYRTGTRNRKTVWLCRCSCGAQREILSGSLLTGRTVSCGHDRAQRNAARFTTHGMTKHPAYKSYNHAKDRCNNPANKDFRYYGGRGVEFKFESFDKFWSEIGDSWQPGLTVDRIDVDGHYEPGNIRWATRAEQNRNQRRTNRKELL